jgi:hypothetical protein
MTIQPALPPDQAPLLFEPGPRLGWVFRDRRSLITPYGEAPPDPRPLAGDVAARQARAQRAWRAAVRWVARPLLPLALVCYAAALFLQHANRHAHTGGLVAASVLLAVAGIGWPAWCLAQMLATRRLDPQRIHQAAVHQWRQRAAAHESAESSRLASVPEWTAAVPPGLRTDVYGGTLAGWQSLLAVHGASLLAARPLLVADFTGQGASSVLTTLARTASGEGLVHLLPSGLGTSGILSGLTGQQFATALTEAIHAGQDSTRADRAVDVRVLQQLTGALGGHLSPARLAAAIQTALGADIPAGILTQGETDTIAGALFTGGYRSQIGPSLVRLDAFASGLARYDTATPARAAWFTCLALEPGPRSAFTELLTALTLQWLTVHVTSMTGDGPAVIIAGADDISHTHLEALTGACEQRNVPLTLLFRHLRDDATTMIGGAATTGFMRLGNHREADQAAAFIGRTHRFVLSGWTAAHGGEQAATRTTGSSHGTSHSRGYSADHSWDLDGAASSSGHSRQYERRQEQSSSDARTTGQNWSDAQNFQRVYEYQVEPSVLQTLPDNALLLPSQPAGNVQAVECDPQIVTLPGFTPAVDDATAHPAISPPRSQSPWPADHPADLTRQPGNQ